MKLITIDRNLKNNKDELLSFFRDRSEESVQEIKQVYSDTQYKKRASAINRAIYKTRQELLKTVNQKANRENWQQEDLLKTHLMVTYVSYIALLEYRNLVWSYEYMAFSRRIGELWEPFVKLCFEYPITDIDLFVPPLFSEVKRDLQKEISDYIDALKITSDQKNNLKKYYQKVWSLVTSGEIKLEMDLHFHKDQYKHVIDFKSGFGSNEKGNTNRLLLVATIYQNLEQNYRCVLLVRSEEDTNNNYFRILKYSGVWEAYCGSEAYDKIKDYSGFNIRNWIENNVDWANDLSIELGEHLDRNNLLSYLRW